MAVAALGGSSPCSLSGASGPALIRRTCLVSSSLRGPKFSLARAAPQSTGTNLLAGPADDAFSPKSPMRAELGHSAARSSASSSELPWLACCRWNLAMGALLRKPVLLHVGAAAFGVVALKMVWMPALVEALGHRSDARDGREGRPRACGLKGCPISGQRGEGDRRNVEASRPFSS